MTHGTKSCLTQLRHRLGIGGRDRWREDNRSEGPLGDEVVEGAVEIGFALIGAMGFSIEVSVDASVEEDEL